LLEGIDINLINIYQKKISELNKMSSENVTTTRRPIDAIRELFEDQQLQITDLIDIVKKQDDDIRNLKAKWKARESIEKEEREKKEREADKSWFWAGRTSD